MVVRGEADIDLRYGHTTNHIHTNINIQAIIWFVDGILIMYTNNNAYNNVKY